MHPTHKTYTHAKVTTDAVQRKLKHSFVSQMEIWCLFTCKGYGKKDLIFSANDTPKRLIVHLFRGRVFFFNSSSSFFKLLANNIHHVHRYSGLHNDKN